MNKEQFLKEYLVDRHGTDSVKWDGLKDKFGDENLIGMWIADTEFKTDKSIREALIKRAEHGVFGYTKTPDEYYTVFSNWMNERYGMPVQKEILRFTTGCVTALAYAINCFTNPGDACMILKPVYYPFFNVVTNNERTLVDIDLDYESGRWSMNYEAIEKAVKENNVKLLLLCSPHNPAGRIWTESELDRLLSICASYNVLVASDEIHQDLVIDKSKRFIPAAAVSGGKYRDIVITINSATKTFNLATLIHGHMLIHNPSLRKKYDKYASGINRTEISIMGMYATMAGYAHGGEWLYNVLEIVRDNYIYFKNTLESELPGVTVCDLESTFLVMVDLRKYCSDDNCKEIVQNRARLAVDYGEWFGDKYKGFIRINLATDPKIVKLAVNNLIQSVKN